MAALSGGWIPPRRRWPVCTNSSSDTALSSVSGKRGYRQAKRLTFADESITAGRGLISKPATDQTQLARRRTRHRRAHSVRPTLLDAVDSAATDINRAVADLPDRIAADIQTGTIRPPSSWPPSWAPARRRTDPMHCRR